MSAGIDVGNQLSVISCARNRGIDVLTNTMSTRFIPTQLTYSNKRLLGELSINQKGIIDNIKRNILKVDGQDLNGESYTYFQLLAMVMTHYRSMLKLNDVKPSDIVFSVPNYFTAYHLHQYYNSAFISGFSNSVSLSGLSKQTHLMKDTTAAALAYCMQHNPSNTNLVLVHLGDLHLEITVALIHEGVHIKSHFCHLLNGSELNEILFEMARIEFKRKFKLDVKENSRASQRLMANVEKCKKILSANSEASIHVEMLMNDLDLSMLVKRSDFEAAIADKKFNIGESIDKAIQLAGLKLSEIHVVECIGGNMRIPFLRQQVVDKFGEKVTSTLNPDECISKGCALYAAILSPQFKTREMKVKDVSLFPIRIIVQNTENPQSTLLYPSGSVQPSAKVLTVNSSSNLLDISVIYDIDAMTPQQKSLFESLITDKIKSDFFNTYEIGGKKFNGYVFYKASIQKIALTDGKATVKLRCRLREDGLFLIERAYVEQIEIIQEKLEKKKKSDKMDVDTNAETMEIDESNTETPADEMDIDGPEKMDIDSSNAKKSEKTIKKEIPSIVFDQSILSNVKSLNKFKEIELNLVSHDQLVIDTEDAKNALEEYIYTVRDKLSGQWADFVDGPIKESLTNDLGATENWIYSSEADSASKSVFTTKLKELQVYGEPIRKRAIEYETRKSVIDKLKKYLDFLNSELSSNKYDHITTEEMEPLAKMVGEKSIWLNNCLPLLEDPSKRSQDPPVWISDLLKAEKELLDSSRILNKAKPKEKKQVEDKEITDKDENLLPEQDSKDSKAEANLSEKQ
eukprot:NODE_41_length_34096_cov_2.002235.p2 type:complete len:799 gc:universal NODE_41_length_34096_cov_2.002235:9059-6663(-)